MRNKALYLFIISLLVGSAANAQDAANTPQRQFSTASFGLACMIQAGQIQFESKDAQWFFEKQLGDMQAAFQALGGGQLVTSTDQSPLMQCPQIGTGSSPSLERPAYAKSRNALSPLIIEDFLKNSGAIEPNATLLPATRNEGIPSYIFQDGIRYDIHAIGVTVDDYLDGPSSYKIYVVIRDGGPVGTLSNGTIEFANFQGFEVQPTAADQTLEELWENH